MTRNRMRKKEAKMEEGCVEERRNDQKRNSEGLVNMERYKLKPQ